MKIVVLAGGLSPERHVSLTSGAMVTQALRSACHEVAFVDLYFDVMESFAQKVQEEIPEHYKTVNTAVPDLTKLQEEKEKINGNSQNSVGNGVISLCKEADITYLALHGACGEDGRLQALLELEQITYTGSNYLSSAIAMDKDLTKRLLSDKIPTANWKKVTVTSENISHLAKKTTLPVVIKPLNSGSSIGVSIAHQKEELLNALNDCLSLGGDTILEDFIEGREIQIAILGDKTLPAIEIIVEDGFYDISNKYTPNLAKEICPAVISDEIAGKLSEYALTAFHTLGLSVLARADFIVTKEGIPYFLEINTLPGMTPTSLVPQEAAAVGIDYVSLCEKIVEESFKKRG